MRGLMYLAACIFCFSLIAQDQGTIKFSGVKIFVHELPTVEDFYTKTLDFEVESRKGDQIRIKTNTWPIVLEKAKNKATDTYPKTARTGLSLQTFKLLPRIDALRAEGVSLYDSLLSRNGVGISIPFEDPSGNVMTTIEVQIRDVAPFDGVRIYNAGVTISDMDAAINFYENILGFEEWSRNYLPDALPLKHTDGSFAFMIHYKTGLQKNTTSYGEQSQIILRMEASDLDAIISRLTSNQLSHQRFKDGIICRDPEGNFIEISSRP